MENERQIDENALRETAIQSIEGMGGDITDTAQNYIATHITENQNKEFPQLIPNIYKTLAKRHPEEQKLGQLATRHTFYHIDDYLKNRSEYTTENDFMPKIFGAAKLRFPICTLSYIGARPGRGKTTLMLSLAMDALENTQKQVLFVSLEETQEEITDRIVLYLCYYDNDAKKIFKNTEQTRTTLFSEIRNLMKNNSTKPFETQIDKIRQWQNQQRLLILDAVGMSQRQILETLEPYKDAIVFIDYIQRVPPERESDQRYIQMQETSHNFAKAAIKNNQIIIAGAQFNRVGQESRTNFDRFTDSSFRESGDIEADGHILIGLGNEWNTANETKYFYTVLKNRSGQKFQSFCFTPHLAFSVLEGTDTRYTEPQPPKGTVTTATSTGYKSQNKY